MSFRTKTVAALVAALASTAYGHGHVTGIVADGVYYGGFSFDYYYEKQNTGTFTESVGWWAEDTDNGFVSPSAYNTSDIVCHINGQPANLTATVAAGGTVDFQWTNWGHPGVVLTYVALCGGDCTDPTLDKTALEWVKIDEGGIDIASQSWATDILEANNMTWSTPVPATLASGNYVFRHEIIAVHGAENVDGAQNYPQCVNIQVTGGGSASPEGTLGTELYTPEDAGIYFNPYTTITNYTIPGPALMEGGTDQTGGSSAVASGSSATATAAATTSSAAAAAAATSSAAATTSSAAAAATTTTSSSSSAVAPSSVETAAAAAAPTSSSTSSCASKRRRHARDVARS